MISMTLGRQLSMKAHCTVRALCFSMGSRDQCYSSIPLAGTSRPLAPAIIAAYRHTQHSTGKTNRITGAQSIDGGVPHNDPLAKYAAAFFKMSRSMRSLAFSLRNRLFSASISLTGFCLAKLSPTSRDSFTQFAKVLEETDSLRAVSAMPNPSSTACLRHEA